MSDLNNHWNNNSKKTKKDVLQWKHDCRHSPTCPAAVVSAWPAVKTRRACRRRGQGRARRNWHSSPSLGGGGGSGRFGTDGAHREGVDRPWPRREGRNNPAAKFYWTARGKIQRLREYLVLIFPSTHTLCFSTVLLHVNRTRASKAAEEDGFRSHRKLKHVSMRQKLLNQTAWQNMWTGRFILKI